MCGSISTKRSCGCMYPENAPFGPLQHPHFCLSPCPRITGSAPVAMLYSTTPAKRTHVQQFYNHCVGEYLHAHAIYQVPAMHIVAYVVLCCRSVCSHPILCQVLAAKLIILTTIQRRPPPPHTHTHSLSLSRSRSTLAYDSDKRHTQSYYEWCCRRLYQHSRATLSPV